MPNPLDLTAYDAPGPTDSAWTTEEGREYLRQKGVVDPRLGNDKLVQDSGDDWVAKKAKELGLQLDDTTRESLTKWLLDENSADNAMARSLKFNNEQWSSLVEGLKKAGLNPMLAIQGLQGANMMSGSSSSVGYSTQRKIASESSNKSMAGSAIGSFLMGLAILIAHAL